LESKEGYKSKERDQTQSYWNAQNWYRPRMSASAKRRLYISAHRSALDSVPCTNTTGISPRLYGVVEMSGGRLERSPERRPSNPNVSSSTIGTPVYVSASAALGSASSGICSPATETDSASQARWSSSTAVSGCDCTKARRACEIRRSAVTSTLSRGATISRP